jgi:prepilin-type N-terminal cleavage/methylation domain-containing protein
MRRAGFTLMEVMVVTLILGVLLGVIAAALSGGIRVLEAAVQFNRQEADLVLALARFEKDVRNSFALDAIGFSGGPDRLSFPALGYEYAPGETNQTLAVPRLIRVTHRFDPVAGAWTRSESEYEGGDSFGREAGQKLASDLRSVRWRYYENRRKQPRGWSESWTSVSNRPAAVEIECVWEESKTEMRRLRRSVVVPVVDRMERSP